MAKSTTKKPAKKPEPKAEAAKPAGTAKAAAAPKKGDDVTWKWGSGEGEGKVAAIHTEDVSKTIKGKKITRHASPEKPAVEIATNKGSRVLKSTTEIEKKS